MSTATNDQTTPQPGAHSAVVDGPAPAPGNIVPGSYQPPLVPAAGSEAGQLSHGFGDNASPVNNIAPGPPFGNGNVLAFVTVTPKVTGKFRVAANVVMGNTSGANEGASIGISHGTGAAPTLDYRQAAVTIPNNQNTSMGLTMEYGSTQAPTVFPTGQPVQINLMGFGGIGESNLNVAAQGAQITVEELPD